jgi:hypothetical protein
LKERLLNVCHFTGTFYENPILEDDNGVSFTRFILDIPIYRKTKAGDKSKSVTPLLFEAWHTGAETIVKLARPGTKITVQCTARWDSEEDAVIFRINEFDFSCLDKSFE